MLNVGSVVNKGLELEWSGLLPYNFNYYTSYTYTSAEQQDDVGVLGVHALDHPRHPGRIDVGRGDVGVADQAQAHRRAGPGPRLDRHVPHDQQVRLDQEGPDAQPVAHQQQAQRRPGQTQTA